MASIWKLPVIFVCENNGYGMSTSTERSTAVKNIADRAAAYSMPGVIVNGNDFSEVAEAVARGGRARPRRRGPDADRDARPIAIAAIRRATATATAPRKRSRTGSPTAIRSRCSRPSCKEFGIVDEEGIEAIRDAVRAEIAAGIEFAKASPSPDIARGRHDTSTRSRPDAWTRRRAS